MSITIKKNFQEIYDVLNNNGDKKVKDLLPELISMMESKQRDSNHRTNENGKLEIFCYYHKQWEVVGEVEYGTKTNSVTGYNTMCKIGVNNWTKQQRDHKKAKADLLNKIADGELDIADLNDELERLEEEKSKIIPLQQSLDELAAKDTTEE